MRVVLTSCSPQDADALATALIERRLAACVSVLPSVFSTYRWQGAVQREEEALLWIKVPVADVATLMAQLPELHPYDVPEILALPAAHVSAPYAAWAARQTGN